MRQIVQELMAGGHQVDFYIRKDGGILIRSIDGERFSGAEGNARAREMVGQEISVARVKQLKFALRQRKQSKKKLPNALEEAYQKTKKKWNKAFHSKKGVPHPAGYFSKKKIKDIYEKYGEEEAMRRINEADRYASGIAYSKNVEHLAGFIFDSAKMYGSQELIKLAEDLIANAYAIREEWIVPAYEKLYELNNGVNPKQVAIETRRILRL